MIRQIDQLFERDPAVVTRTIGTELVLVPVRSSTATMSHVYALNDTGAFVWHTLHTPASAADLAAALAHSYTVEPEQAQHDVQELLHLLLHAQLVREVP